MRFAYLVKNKIYKHTFFSVLNILQFGLELVRVILLQELSHNYKSSFIVNRRHERAWIVIIMYLSAP